MTYRLTLSYALIAGLSVNEARRMTPGMIADLYIYRMRYDDMEHGIRRKKPDRCAD